MLAALYARLLSTSDAVAAAWLDVCPPGFCAKEFFQQDGINLTISFLLILCIAPICFNAPYVLLYVLRSPWADAYLIDPHNYARITPARYLAAATGEARNLLLLGVIIGALGPCVVCVPPARSRTPRRCVSAPFSASSAIATRPRFRPRRRLYCRSY